MVSSHRIFLTIFLIVLIGNLSINEGAQIQNEDRIEPENLPIQNSDGQNREERQGKPQDVLKGVGTLGTKLAAGAQNLFKGVEHFVVNILSGINDVNFENQGIDPITPSTPDPDEETTIPEEETTFPVIRTTIRPIQPVAAVATINTPPTTTFPKRRRPKPPTMIKGGIPEVQNNPLPPVGSLPSQISPAVLPASAYILLPGYPHPVPIYQHLPISPGQQPSNWPVQVSSQNSQPLIQQLPSNPTQNEPLVKLTGNQPQSNPFQLNSVQNESPLKSTVEQNAQIEAIKAQLASNKPSKVNQNQGHLWVAGVQNIQTNNSPGIQNKFSGISNAYNGDLPPLQPVTTHAPTTRRPLHTYTRRKLFVSNTSKRPIPVKVIIPPFGTIIRPKEPQDIQPEPQKRPSEVNPDYSKQTPSVPAFVPIDETGGWSPRPPRPGVAGVEGPEEIITAATEPEEEGTTEEGVTEEETEIGDTRESKANNLKIVNKPVSKI